MLSDFYRIQLDGLAALQQLAGLRTFFKLITLLGNEEFFLLLIPLLFICVSRSLGLRLGLLVLASDALNVLLKLVFAQPRPYWLDSRVHGIVTDASFGLPSSHAQNAVAVWFFLAWYWRRRHPGSAVYPAAAALVLLISLSRLYLGVHFPTDVLAGWLIGGCFLVAFLKIEPALAARATGAGRGALASLAALVPLALLLVAALMSHAIATFGDDLARIAAHSGIEAMASRSGALCGLGLGLILAQSRARFAVEGSAARRIGNFIFVFIGILVFWRGLGMIFPNNAEPLGLALRFLRYALLTGWVTYLAPLLLLRWGWLRPVQAATQP